MQAVNAWTGPDHDMRGLILSNPAYMKLYSETETNKWDHA